MNFKIITVTIVLYAIYLISLENGVQAKKEKKKTNYTAMAQDVNNMFGKNFSKALNEFKDAEFFKMMSNSLRGSPETIQRHLKEEAHKAFLAYSNARYQHCWNSTVREIPPEIYLASIKCASKKFKTALIKFNQTLHTLVKIKEFANHTYAFYKQCKENLQSLRSPPRSKRGLREFGVKVKDQSKRVYQKAKHGLSIARNYVVRYSKIVGHYVGRKAQIMYTFVKVNFKKMRTKMSDFSHRALEKYKSMKTKIFKFVDKAQKVFFCFKGAYDVVVNASTILDDLIGRYKMLEGMGDIVHECVSDRIDKYAPKICNNKFVVPEVSDMDDMITYYGLKDVPDDFD